jgi:5-hydroxyisourate hydrolase
MSVSIRIVDCVYGRPAVGVSVDVTRERDGLAVWQRREQTDDEGCLSGLLEPMRERGSYTLVFDLDDYYRKLGHSSLTAAISIRLHAASPTLHSHLSLLITPTSCTAYRMTELPRLPVGQFPVRLAAFLVADRPADLGGAHRDEDG